MVAKKAPAVVPRIIREDAWKNILTGIGVENKDKRMAGSMSFDGPLRDQEVEAIYAGDGQARRLVDILPNEATRQWIKFNKTIDASRGPIHDEIKRLKIKAKVKKGWIDARLYGGAGVFLNVGDPIEELKNPLDLRNIQKLISLIPFDRWELQTQTTDTCVDLMSDNFGQPEIYRLQVKNGVSSKLQSIPIHHSRIVRFDGLMLPNRMAVSNQLWGDSVFTSIYEILRDYGMSYSSVANILHDFRILVYKISGLSEMVETEDIDKLRVRLQAMNLTRSVIGAYMLDSEEEMSYFSSSVQGIAELLTKMKERLQAAVDIPHTILFNESPSGLGATGRSEESQWFDYVKAQQETYLEPILDRIFLVMFAGKQGPTRGAVPADLSYTFNPLWQESEKEKAELKKLKAETAKINIDTNVMSNDEVRQADYPELEGPAPEVETPDPAEAIPAMLSAGKIAGAGNDPSAATGK